MSNQLKSELEHLEQSGRISLRGHRPVHAAFGFTEIAGSTASSQQPAASTQHERASTQHDEPLARDLDAAFSRLKSTIEPS